MIPSQTKTCKLASNGYDQRSKGACCFIKNGWDKFPSPGTVKGYLNSAFIKEVRHALANGEEHSACEKCWQDEANGKKSKRIHADVNLDSQPDGVLTQLSLFSGNKCNLACRTCGAHSSTGWFKEHQYILKQTDNFPGVYDKAKIKNFSNKINVPLDKLQYIEVLGGEPFYETEHLEFLERVCREADPSKITLFYSTNGTKTIEPSIEKMFNKFKNIMISFSIDAVGKRFEYIRTLGVWDQVEETIAYWKSRPNVSLKNHATMSVLNIMYANEVWKYFTDVHGFENNQIGYTYAIFPPHYNYSVISNATKTKHMDWILNSLSFGQHTKSIQSYFKNAEYNEQNFKYFLDAIKYTNDFRKLDIQDYLPELCKVLDL